MKIVLQKKTILIVSAISLMLLLIVAGVYLFLTRDIDIMEMEEYYSSCEEFGCQKTGDSLIKEVEVTVLNFDRVNELNSLMTFETWNSETNNVIEINLKIQNQLIKDIDGLLENQWPKKYIFSMSAEERKVGIPLWSYREDRLLVSKQKVNEVSLINPQAMYLTDENSFDYSSIRNDIMDSLIKVEDLDEENVLSSVILLYKDTISKAVVAGSDYEYLEILDARQIAEDMKAEELEANCGILKKYYPDSDCKNPKDIIINDTLETILSSEEFARWDLETALNDVIVGNSQNVSSVRNNDEEWKEYYHAKRFVITRELNKHMYSLLDYLYYSDISCDGGENKEVCENIYKIYNYSQHLVNISEGNLCSAISYLPYFVEVTGDSVLEEDLVYILENYPFKSECTTKGGKEGFCSVDLKERIACLQFLSNSLKYYKEDEEVANDLKFLIDDTLSVNLKEEKGRLGVWGTEDINLLMGVFADEELFPLKYFDYRDNFLIYNLLGEYINE